MNGRKGDQSTTFWVITAVLSAAVLYLSISGAWRSIEPIVFVVDLVGFETTPPEGNGIIGLNLKTGGLEYYAGDQFKKFSEEKSAVLAGYEINLDETKNKLNDFYFNTKRRPEMLNISINDWRYAEASLGNKNTNVRFSSKNGFIGSDSVAYYNFDEMNKFNFVSATEGQLGTYVYDFSQFEISKNSKLTGDLIAWRDSILQANKCEKFLTLRVKQNSTNEMDVNYNVRKSDGYLVIDLTAPIIGGLSDKWSDPNCFGVTSNLENSQPALDTFNIYLRDYFLEKDLYFSFNSSIGWAVSPSTKYIDKGWFSSQEKDRYPLDSPSLTSENPKYSLIYGMNKILQIAGDMGYIDSNVEFYRGSEITYIGGEMTFINFYQKRNGLTKEEMAKLPEIIYDILTEYNKGLIR